MLLGGVAGYNILTDDERVRSIVEVQLSLLIGEPVRVESASFTLLGGLNARNVSVYVDDKDLPDSRLVMAGSINVQVKYSELLKLRLRLLRIEAQQVIVMIAEDMQDHTFNIQRLLRSIDRQAQSRPVEGPQTTLLQDTAGIPSVTLRDAHVVYVRKTGTRMTPSGDLRIDAVIDPMPDKKMLFTVLAKTTANDVPVTMLALLDRRAGDITGRIGQIGVDHRVPDLLPAQIQRALDDFEFAGKFSIPRFRYAFASDKHPEAFDVTLRFDGVRAQVRPRHWLSKPEIARMGMLNQTVKTLAMMGANEKLAPGELAGDITDLASPRDLISYLQLNARSVPLQLEDLHGNVTFSSGQVVLEHVGFDLQGQSLIVDGAIYGYAPQAPGSLHVRTAPDKPLHIPPSRQFLTWLPDEFRRIYVQFQPQGKADLDIKLQRKTPGGDFIPSVEVNLTEASFIFDDFPYPLRETNGTFVFWHDEQLGEDVLEIRNLRGRGVAGGPNADSYLTVNGRVGPFVHGGSGVDIRIRGDKITSEPLLRAAFPPEVEDALRIFAPLDYAARRARLASPDEEVPLTPAEVVQWPFFTGDFAAHIVRPPGPKKHWATDVDMRLSKTAGSLIFFPYPLENLACVLKLHDGSLTIEDAKMQRGDAQLSMSGVVKFTNPANPDIHIKALHVPINDDLLNALPVTERSWINRAGVGGHVDIIGRIFLKKPSPGVEPGVDFGLDLLLHDAVLLKDSKGPAFTQLNGELWLQPSSLQIRKLTGRRGNGAISASGKLHWPKDTFNVNLQLDATDLLLDNDLRAILPKVAQDAWDQQKPEGTTDLSLSYVTGSSATTPPTDAISLVLRPRKLSATLAAFPYRLDDLQGEVRLENGVYQIKDLKARHDQTSIVVNGGGTASADATADLKITATKLKADAQLLAALPESMAGVIKGMQPSGDFDIRVDTLKIRPATQPSNATATSQTPPTTGPATRPSDIDFACVVSTANGTVNVGAPITDLVGWASFNGDIRSDQLYRLDGEIVSSSYKLFGRDGTDFRAAIRRPEGTQSLLMQDLKTHIGGGTLSGGLTLLSPDKGPSQYAIDLTIQHANVSAMTAAPGKSPGSAKSPDILPSTARASASVSIEGIFDNPASRRGRGDILIQGQNMYQAPIVLGLFRMVNFALPVRDGVNEVVMSYILSGDKVTVDNIEMKSPGLRIYGSGVMDFATRKLDFTLNTENPDALSIPLIGTLVRRAQKELLEIRIRGTLQEPQVQASSLPTFQATLSEVVADVKRNKK